MDIKEYIKPFIEETEENLQKLNDLLLAFEEGGRDGIDDIFRISHTLKGMAATMGFSNMTALTHAMEDVLDGVRKREVYLKEENDISLLFECLDTLNRILESIRNCEDDSPVDTDDITARLKEFLQGKNDGEEKAENCVENSASPLTKAGLKKVEVKLNKGCMLKGARAFMVMEEISSLGRVEATEPSAEHLVEGNFEGDVFYFFVDTQVSDDKIVESVENINEVLSCRVEGVERSVDPAKKPAVENAVGSDVKPDNESQATITPRKASQTIRVDVKRLDNLLNLVGELVIGRSRIERLAKDSGFKEFEEPMIQLGRISKEIQELVTKLRMLPISFIFDRFPRLVRDLSHSLGKKVSLHLEGRETELDRSVIDEIGDPMVHLIRNSLDHGLECPEDRIASGKCETGSLRVRAYQDGSSVVVAVEDDGRGIDREKVLDKALEKGLVAKDQAENLEDREVFQFLFVPGFSTSVKVSDISGRGVGMDAVRNKVESLGGRVAIESEKGSGTSVKVKLPITLAIVLALLVRIEKETYAIPLESVDETLRVPRREVKSVNGGKVAMLRGEILNLVDSRRFYGIPDREEQEDLSIVVMRTGFRRVGFVVDEFIGQQEIVIKSLGSTTMARIKWFSGGTILGDGSVALIIDPAVVEDAS